jgi:hypothetical protein
MITHTDKSVLDSRKTTNSSKTIAVVKTGMKTSKKAKQGDDFVGTKSKINKVSETTPTKAVVQESGNKNGVFTLGEVQLFIDQHNATKTIALPGRTLKDIGIIHEAYNRSTYKYATNILQLLNKWANN